MKKFMSMASVFFAILLIMASPAFAADGGVEFSGAFGAGLVAIGGAYGIGRLSGCALESMARQPEIAGKIQVAMIISVAMIEGFIFFALVICMQQNPFAAVGQ